MCRLRPSGAPVRLTPLLAPRGVAVLGASRDPDSVGGAILRNLLAGGFTGAIYPVNPHAETLGGLRCYPSILDVPDPVDAAIVILKAALVPGALEQCGQRGVPGAIVISAGFREVGGDGVALEQRVKAVCDRCHLTLIGPNCLGVLNTDPAVRLNATFAKAMPARGCLGFISQSGALCTAVLEYARGEQIGFSMVASLGNTVDVTELELLEALRDDPGTRVILLYVEALSDGRKFIELAREITGEGPHRKPILAIKAGRTPAGVRAASSHTGALAGRDEVYDAIFAQAGVMRVESVEELFDYAVALAGVPLPRGRRVAIVTNAGGPGIITADACVRQGLELATLTPATIAAVTPHVPPTAALHNPLDLIGDARHERYEAALQAVVQDPQVDSVVVVVTPQAMTDLEPIATVIAQAAASSSKPVLACLMGVTDAASGINMLTARDVPHYRFPESAVRALAALSRYGDWLDRPRTAVKTFPVDRAMVRRVFARARRAGRSVLTQAESFEVLTAYGFPMLRWGIARTAGAARRVAATLRGPVAMKILSAQIIHKVDVGGVQLNLRTPNEITKAFRTMMTHVAAQRPDATLDGVVIQAMAPPDGVETIVGMSRDPQFGPLLMFGLGGVAVEILRDVTFRLAPIRELGAQRMVASIRAHQLLEGFRGQLPSDLPCLVECLERLSQLAVECEEVAELDINPLIVYPLGQGAVVADARITLT